MWQERSLDSSHVCIQVTHGSPARMALKRPPSPSSSIYHPSMFHPSSTFDHPDHSRVPPPTHGSLELVEKRYFWRRYKLPSSLTKNQKKPSGFFLVFYRIPKREKKEEKTNRKKVKYLEIIPKKGVFGGGNGRVL